MERNLPAILRVVEIDPDAVYWLISDGQPDENGIEWQYEFYIKSSKPVYLRQSGG